MEVMVKIKKINRINHYKNKKSRTHKPFKKQIIGLFDAAYYFFHVYIFLYKNNKPHLNIKYIR